MVASGLIQNKLETGDVQQRQKAIQVAGVLPGPLLFKVEDG